jgi:ATP-dependent helicase HrpB
VIRPLPIDPLLPEITAALGRGSRVVLRAPPGAGKTTRVPAALLDAGIAGAGAVLVLEPRRIAARAAAEWVARERGGSVGGDVGYRVRFEQRGGPATRLWFVTEGIFERQLASDPFLEGTGVVVLDEFHERHLAGDVALAVVRELQDTVRPDLKLVVMSATLDTDRLAAFLPDAAVLTSSGREHPVAIEYADTPVDVRALPARVVVALRHVLAEPGDVLVFLPGAGEIRRTAEAAAPLATSHALDIVTLHGDQPLEAQERALHAGPRRRVVLATNVAETALTVEGVTTVVDSGLARVARHDPRHGINTLRVVPVSRAAADQRAGRAGRTAPGRCLRLWTRGEHVGRRAHETPEVLRLDLTRIVLALRAWGLRDAATLCWLDAPPPATLARAERLLAWLGAVDATGALTPTGRRMLALPVEPRLARLLVEAERQGCPAEGALVAALASERDVLLSARAFGGTAPADWPPGRSDLLLRLELFEDAARRGFGADACRALGLDPAGVRRVDRARRQLARSVGRSAGVAADADALLRCALAGFGDRVVRRRAPGSPRGVMVGGTGVALGPESVVREAELLVALDLEGGAGAEARVRMASAIEPSWLNEVFPGSVRTERETVFDPARERVVMRVQERYHDLVLAESVRTDVDPEQAGALLAEVARADPAAAAGVGAAEEDLLARLAFLRRWMPELELPASDALLGDAVAALCAGRRSFAELRTADLGSMLRGLLTHPQRTAVDREAPSHLRLPNERLAPVRYEPDRAPAVAARIQEVFGLRATPRVANGRVALLLELLAPSQRPVQITDDLASFWRTTYAEIRRELRGRYPKHAWPEDPLTAPPSRRRR